MYDCLYPNYDELAQLKLKPTYPIVSGRTGSLYYVQERERKAKRGNQTIIEKESVIMWLSVKITVLSIICDEETSIKTLKVKVILANGDVEEGEINCEYLHTKKISEILKYGWSYNENLSTVLVAYLQKSMQYLPMQKKYHNVGWKMIDNHLTFRTNNVLLDKTNYLDGYIYDGYMDFNYQYNTNDYIADLNNLLITSGSEFAIVTGLASVMLARVKMFAKVDNTIVHIYGASSHGKTTFANIATSLWGNPEECRCTWNATDNSMYSFLNGNNGVVVVFDEASGVKQNFSELIYSISNGRDKMRCQKDSTIIKPRKWSTIIVTTAEKSLLESSDQNEGLGVRCLEFYNLIVTKDGKHADDLDEFVRNNYGLLGEEFAGLLLETDEQQLKNELNTMVKRIDDTLEIASNSKNPAITNRCSKIYAVFMLTAKYAQKIGVNIKPKHILRILVEQYKSLIKESKAEKVYNAVMEYIFSNGAHFANEETIKNDSQNYYGYSDGDYYYVVESIFKSILRNNKITDIQNTMKLLADSNRLIKNKDRYYHRKTINKKQIKFYKFPNSDVLNNDNEKGGNENE